MCYWSSFDRCNWYCASSNFYLKSMASSFISMSFFACMTPSYHFLEALELFLVISELLLCFFHLLSQLVLEALLLLSESILVLLFPLSRLLLQRLHSPSQLSILLRQLLSLRIASPDLPL